MNIKNGILLVLGAILFAVVIFFVVKQDLKAPTVNPTSTSVTGTAVSIAGYQFTPNSLTVKRGQTVTWTNNDTVSHVVAGDVAPWIEGSPLTKGETYTHTFDTIGTFTYHCAVHPSMHGTIIVTE